jgi:anthranilate synthase
LTESYGGSLRELAVPVHGKPSRIRVSSNGVIFSGLAKEVTVGRYHSIFRRLRDIAEGIPCYSRDR